MKAGIAFVRAIATVAALSFVPVGTADAAGLLGIAGRSAARKLAASKPRDVIVHRRQHPEAAAHIEHAQRNGQPTVLTMDRAHAAERRADSLRHVRRSEGRAAIGKDRDEYPPAMTREGGFNANVRSIDAHDNRGAGKSIANQVRDVPDGERIRVLVAD